MTLQLTDAARREALKLNIEPQLVLQIEGIPTLFGAVEILKFIRIGDPGLFVGSFAGWESWVIGGKNAVDDQEDLISLDGTSTSITQQLRPDQGAVSSVSSVQVRLIDADNLVTKIISPGVLIDDALFSRATLYFGFASTAWPEDYIKIFSGFIDEMSSGAGHVTLNLVHPDQKKRQQIYQNIKTKVATGIGGGDTSLTVTDTTGFLTPVLGPTLVNDPSLKFYIRINDEVIRYTGISGSVLTGLTRGEFGTVAASHDADDDVTSLYVLEGEAVDLALKVMLSGVNGSFVDSVPVESFNVISPTLNIANTIFFKGVNIDERYGLTPGDFLTTTGAANGANNVSLKEIAAITRTQDGSYILVSGVSFVDESASSAVISFRSKYDTLGEGLSMSPEDVDVPEHERWRDIVFSDFDMRHYLKDTMDGKEFIEKELYSPAGAYSIPRKGRSSMGFHIGPIPSVDIKILDQENIKRPSQITIKRSISRHFYNTVVYAFDEDILEDRFLSGVITPDTDSRARIPVGNAVLKIESKGMRSDLSGAVNARRAAERRLNRYKFGSEHFEQVKVLFGTGFNIEAGDLVIVDFEGLQVSNTANGTREKPAKFFEVINIKTDLKNGETMLTLVDTNFDASERYGLISPSSKIATAGTTDHVIIEDSFGALFPLDESRKWRDYVGLPITVHSEDFSFSEDVTLTEIDPVNPNRLNVSPALSSPTVAGWVIDLPLYPDVNDKAVNRLYKLVHAHWSPRVDVVSGIDDFSFTVGAGDAAKFFVGSPVIVHTDDFSTASTEVKVTGIVGVTISVDNSLGFTPAAGQFISLIGFADEDQPYRLI